MPNARLGLVALTLASGVGIAHADDPPGTLMSDDTWQFQAGGPLVVDGGLAIARPAALPTGVALGLGAGVAQRNGLFQWGARVDGLTTTESSATWIVTQRELRVRATAAIAADAGRATIALRLGLGGDLVHELREREQGVRAGLTGAMLEQRALAILPAGELALALDLHIAGRWMLAIAGGPTLALVNGSELRGGFTSMLGVGWR